MIEAFLERSCEVHCLSLTPIPIIHSYFHNHIIYLPVKTEDGFIAKLAVVFLFPLWSFWIAWSKRIDIIIAFGSLYAFLQGFSKWILRKPMVTFIRGNFYFGLKIQNSPRYFLYLNKIVEYLGFLFSDQIITNNVAARDEIVKGLGRRMNFNVQVLYNNIPSMNINKQEDISRTRGKHGIPQDAKILVTAGILNRCKNIEILIKCLPKIGIEDVYVLIVGDGSTEVDLKYKDFLQDLARKLKVDKRVIFTGWLEKEELWKIYQVSDLFVLPSLNEGMPNAMLEALGLNLPCLGSNIPSARDILQYEELMFDLQNWETLSKKINRFFADDQYFQKIKGLCKERKRNFIFDWKKKVFQAVTAGVL